MINIQHGPWTLNYESRNICVQENGKGVAIVGRDPNKPGLDETRAKLIAAAPDMAEALKVVLDELSNRAETGRARLAEAKRLHSPKAIAIKDADAWAKHWIVLADIARAALVKAGV